MANETSQTASENPILKLETPQLNFDFFSIIDFLIILLLIFSLFWLILRGLKFLQKMGLLGAATLFSKCLYWGNYLLTGLLITYSLTQFSQDSLGVSLFLLVIVTLGCGVALVEPAKSLLATLLILIKQDLQVGDHISISGASGRILSLGPLNIVIESDSEHRIYFPCSQLLKTHYEVQKTRGGPKMSFEFAGSISRSKIEKLAIFCPFRKENSDIKLTKKGETYKLDLEIIHREAQVWAQQYFNNYLNKKKSRKF